MNIMTALKKEAIYLVQQMPEEEMPYIIHLLKDRTEKVTPISDKLSVSSKMKAFTELEEMLIPVSSELDYDKELAEARDKKYGYHD